MTTGGGGGWAGSAPQAASDAKARAAMRAPRRAARNASGHAGAATSRSTEFLRGHGPSEVPPLSETTPANRWYQRPCGRSHQRARHARVRSITASATAPCHWTKVSVDAHSYRSPRTRHGRQADGLPKDRPKGARRHSPTPATDMPRMSLQFDGSATLLDRLSRLSVRSGRSAKSGDVDLTGPTPGRASALQSDRCGNRLLGCG